MLYRPEAFEPLTDMPWDESRGRAVAADCIEARSVYPILDSWDS